MELRHYFGDIFELFHLTAHVLGSPEMRTSGQNFSVEQRKFPFHCSAEMDTKGDDLHCKSALWTTRSCERYSVDEMVVFLRPGQETLTKSLPPLADLEEDRLTLAARLLPKTSAVCATLGIFFGGDQGKQKGLKLQ